MNEYLLWNYQACKFVFDYKILICEHFKTPLINKIPFNKEKRLKHERIAYIGDIKFVNNNIFTITEGGFIFKNNKIINRLWDNVRNCVLFVLSDETLVIFDTTTNYLFRTNKYGDILYNDVIKFPFDCLTIASNGDIFVAYGNSIFKYTLFEPYFPKLLDLCVDTLSTLNNINLTVLPNDLVSKIL